MNNKDCCLAWRIAFVYPILYISEIRSNEKVYNVTCQFVLPIVCRLKKINLRLCTKVYATRETRQWRRRESCLNLFKYVTLTKHIREKRRWSNDFMDVIYRNFTIKFIIQCLQLAVRVRSPIPLSFWLYTCTPVCIMCVRLRIFCLLYTSRCV